MAWTCRIELNNEKLSNFNVSTHFSDRFSEDKVFIKNDADCIVIDGVILNKSELQSSYGLALPELAKNNLWGGTAQQFVNELRGPFTGLFLHTGNLCAFGNQTGDASVFYYGDAATVIISSDFNEAVKECRNNNKTLTFNEVYANHILSFGYAVEGNTVIKEIKKVNPGCYITIERGKIVEKVYHRFETKKREISIEQAVDELDVAFRKAVKRCFGKDLEYGYMHHLADMSGGFDSRMTSWVAHDMGYRDVTNITYSKSGSFEEIYGRQVAQALGNEFIFEYLDDVAFIFDLEKLVSMNFGLATYVGITGGQKILSGIDFAKFGLEHTGQLGDVVVGSFCKRPEDDSAKSIRNLQYGDWITPIVMCAEQFESQELFSLYYRGFSGTLMTHHIRRHYTEAVSPFIDVDFLQFCLSLPLEYRCGHKLYFKWLQEKYSDALLIPSTRKQPGEKKLSKKDIYHMLPTWMRHAIISVSKSLHIAGLISDKQGMNPMDYWYQNNAGMRSFINGYFSEHIAEMSSYPDVVTDLRKVFDQGRTMDKLLVLTVVAAFHLYIVDTAWMDSSQKAK